MTRRSWLLFVAMSVLWGLPYLLIRVAVRDLSPATVVAARTALGALLLLPLAVRRGGWRALGHHWVALLCFTGLEITGPWFLLVRAEQHLPSALTGLLVAATPLVAAVATRVVGGDVPLTRIRILGLLVGLAGVAALLGLDLGGADAGAAAEVGLVVLGYGTAPLVLNRYLHDVPPLAVIVSALTLTAVVYLPGALAAAPTEHPDPSALLSVGLLAAVCTALAFVVFFALIADAGPNRALVITFVNPAVAVVLGVTVLGEHLTAAMVLGFSLILAGAWTATRRPRPTGVLATSLARTDRAPSRADPEGPLA